MFSILRSLMLSAVMAIGVLAVGAATTTETADASWRWNGYRYVWVQPYYNSYYGYNSYYRPYYSYNNYYRPYYGYNYGRYYGTSRYGYSDYGRYGGAVNAGPVRFRWR